MAAVDERLIGLARNAFNVEDLGPIGAPGGQKAVRHVRRSERDLVLKVISVDHSTAESLRRAEREVQLLASLNSPHVVKVISELIELDSPIRGAAWLEEFLDGSDLAPLLDGRQWPIPDAIRMAKEIAQGLAAGHAKGVVHRDLSPNNVRRLDNGTYKVMDFGFARYTLRSGLTVAGQPGTLGFLSPEHLQHYSGAPTAASDVFVVGILLYMALTGVSPIPYWGDYEDYVRRLKDVVFTDVIVKRCDLTQQYSAVVQRCLHPQPARRYRNGERLALALEDLS